MQQVHQYLAQLQAHNLAVTCCSCGNLQSHNCLTLNSAIATKREAKTLNRVKQHHGVAHECALDYLIAFVKVHQANLNFIRSSGFYSQCKQ